MEETYITVEDGLGERRTMPKSKYPELEQTYEELRKLAEKRGTAEDIKMFTLRIVKDW